MELLYVGEHCQDCGSCEDEFRRHVSGNHPGVKAMARTFDHFTATEWQYIAAPVTAAVDACPHGALILNHRGR